MIFLTLGGGEVQCEVFEGGWEIKRINITSHTKKKEKKKNGDTLRHTETQRDTERHRETHAH